MKENILEEQIPIKGTEIGGTDFRESEIGGTDIKGTEIRGTDFRVTEIGGTYFEGTERKEETKENL